MVTRPDAPAGRGRRLTPSPVARRADELGVPVLKPEHPRDPEFQAAAARLGPDCCPVVAYGALLPQSALDIPAHGWVNLHFSCLPAWRGAAPVQHAIWAGDEVTGATTFRIVKELDAGPTFGVMTERIRPTDTAGDLLARLAEGGAGLLVATLDGIEDGIARGPAAARRGASASRPRSPSTTPGRLGRACRRRRPADPRLHARRPAPGRPTTATRLKLGPVTLDRTTSAARRASWRSASAEVLVGTGTTAGPARRGQGVRGPADARRRLGARRPPGAGTGFG